MLSENSDLTDNEASLSAIEIREELTRHIETLDALCAALEELADELPSNVNNQRALYIARTIYSLVCKAHLFEESIVFPFLEKSLSKNPAMRETINRLKSEHWEDESYAIELQDGLSEFVTNRSEQDSERLGYMLRGFFEGMRRHLAFEREHILPMLREIN